MLIGDLVESKEFRGIGKIIDIYPETNIAVVGFFESPLKPASNQVHVQAKSLNHAPLSEEAVIYCRDPQTKIWCRGRYIGERPEERKHLVAFRRGENALISTDDLYCINLAANSSLNPSEFLAAKANDAPFFFPLREEFVASYLEQRAACRSISSLPSSSVELEQHQLAVVRRVLQDPVPKYLLADEVGLGKTIEAGLIIREHVLEKKREARVVIAVPENLIWQWRKELVDRFFLGDLLQEGEEEDSQIKICAHEDLLSVVDDNSLPSLLTVDEAHQIAHLAWSKNTHQNMLFSAYARVSDKAEVCLLLTGTPLNGNEKNFLAMLHCLSPKANPLDEDGLTHFKTRVEERERLGGLYGALSPATPNSTIEGILSELVDLFPSDDQLFEMTEQLRPLVDFFAPIESDERQDKIMALRRYIGEHYRLHHRLLRNRRENSDLEILFPGLDGLSRHYWSVNIEDVTLDEAIDDYRSRAFVDPEFFQEMSADKFLPWIDDLLTSPMSVGKRAESTLSNKEEKISEEESEILEQILEVAREEQNKKDQLLIRLLQNWLNDNSDGKAVVFCTQKELVHYLVNELHDQIDGGVIHNWDKDVETFNLPDNEARVLICDQRGEDGLNLNGGSRLAVHYSLPRDISRIEQRLGRFNRYSANLKKVKPVQSIVLLPEQSGVTGYWVDLLDGVMHVFNRTLASLQYMLEEQIDITWKEYIRDGYSAFSKAGELLSGEDGLISTEFKRVKAQEELMSMEEEVEEAFEFAEQLEEADEIAEAQVRRMTGWITRALQFRQKGRPGEGFRFQFYLDPHYGARTLVDVNSFISTCLVGLDFDGGFPPVTMPMSASRTEVSDGLGLYPFRYGQPFVDTIWDLMQKDARGTTMAFLRFVPGVTYPEPEIFFRFSWFISAHKNDANRVEQRIADERFLPVVKTFWLRQDGQSIDDETTAILDPPYKSHCNTDCNLRSKKWHMLEDWFPSDQWEKMILALTEQAFDYCLASFKEKKYELYPRLLSVKVVVLCHTDLLSEIEDR